MNRRPLARPRPHRRRADHGFSLIEVLIALTLSSVIGGVIVAALITSMSAARSTTDQIRDSADAGLISAYLIRDAQSAGGIDPGTALPGANLGVSNDPSDPVGNACTDLGRVVGSPLKAALKVRFSWIDRTSTAATSKVVTYALGADRQLTRRECTNSAFVDASLGSNVAQAQAVCQPVPIPPATFCSARPTSVSLELTGSSARAPFQYTLTAALRTVASQLAIIGPPTLAQGELGMQYQIVMSTIGATDPTTWSVTGMPAGFQYDASTGTVWGAPTEGGRTYTMKWTVTDASGATASKAYDIYITAPPVAVADGYTVKEDETLNVGAPGVLTNDPNPQGKTAILYSGVANGALTFTSDGSFIYTPRSNFNGTDSFRYKMSDGSIDSNIVTVTVTVTEVNDPPVNRVPVTQETRKNANKVFTNSASIWVSDVDAPSSVEVQLISSNGKATLSGVAGLTFKSGDSGTADADMTFTGAIPAVNYALANLTFTPTTDFVGEASLRVRSSDLHSGSGGAGTDDDTIVINVTSMGIFSDHTNIGALPTAPGIDSTFTSPTYTVKGSGWDIWEANDGFQFLYRPLTGDGSLTARVASETVTYPGGSDQNPTCWAADNSHQQPCISVAKAGVMFRQNLTEVSAVDAMVGLTQGNGSEFIYRKTAGTTTSSASPGDSLSAPYWVRLTRRGDSLTAEVSPNGTTWTQRGTTQTIAMGSTIYVGLASSAVYQLDSSTNQRIKLNTATFDNVSISTPPVAVADSYSVNEDMTLTVDGFSGVLANDSDPEGAILSAVGVSSTAGLTLNSDGSFTYVPPPNFTGTASFAYVANDGILNSAMVPVTIAVNPANETPSFTKGPDQVIGSNLAAQTVAGWATAISQGTGETGQLVDFIVTNSSNALFAVQPAVSADGTLTFASAPDATGTATASVSIHDNGGTANGAADTSAAQTFTIIVDNPPVVTASGASLAFTENSSTPLDSAITVTDSDNGNLASATVAMTTNYVNGQDTLAFTNQNGITGTWTPATGVLALSGTSTVANYQAALRSITYSNTSHNPSTATRTVTFVVNDALLASNTTSRTITVAAVNDAPVVAATGSSLAYTENATPALDAGFTVTDPDSANLSSATVDMTSNYLNGQDTLAFVAQSGITGTWNSATGVLTLTGSATVANYQAALRSVTYNNNSDVPNTLPRTVTFVVNDGLLDSNTASRTITITSVNDAPVNSIPGNQATPRNTAEVFSSGNNSLISISDADAGSNTMQVQLVSTNGTTTLSGVSGLTFKSGDSGTADADMTFTGSTANINAALSGLSFNPTTNFTGAASLKIVTSDQGSVGTGGTLTDTDTITITVAYAPTVTVSGSLSYTENGSTVLASSISVADSDSTNLASATVRMTANYASAQDSLVFTNQNGITGTWDSNTGVLSLTGSTTKANYQTALRSIKYTDSSDDPSTLTRMVTFVVNDGLLDSNIGTRTITISAVNDAPVNTVPGAQSTPRNTAEVFSSANGTQISVSDVDIQLGTMQVQLVSTNGTATLSGVNGLTFSAGDGTADATMTFTGSPSSINAALAGLRFTPTTNYVGSGGRLQVVTSDLGNTGSGGAKTATNTINITMT